MSPKKRVARGAPAEPRKAVSMRAETKAVENYLNTLNTPRKRGRPDTADDLQARINHIERHLHLYTSTQRLKHIQDKLELEERLARLRNGASSAAAEAAFIEHASAWAQRKGISYRAFRDAGVPASVLEKAGIARYPN